MTQKELDILTNIIGGVETGGQVYGNRRYGAYAPPYNSTRSEVTCTLGWAQNYGNKARKLCQMIYDTNKTEFKKADSANIEAKLKIDWERTKWRPTTAQKNALVAIITTTTGKKCQDQLFQELAKAYIRNAEDYGIKDVAVQMLFCEIEHLGGLKPTKRIFNRAKKPYTVDTIFDSLILDQKDTSNSNQVGDKIFQSRHECCVKWIKKYVLNTSTTTTDKGGVNKMTGEEIREAIGKCYDEIIGRNYYSQNLRDYCYTKYKNGLYYSDCSSSISYAYKRAGYGFGILNTAGMYYKLKTVKDITISGGQIQNVSKLRKGDCLMFKGSDPSRPLQIGHVEMVRAINGLTAASVIICGHGSGRPSKKNMRDYCAQRYNAGRGLVCVLRYIDDNGNVYTGDGKSSTSTTLPSTKRSYLQKGDSGSAVKTMQTMLIKCGYSCGKSGADGDFGTGTQTALKAFQKAYKLEVDGKYGSASKAKLEAVYKEKTKTTTSTTTKPSTSTSTSSSKTNTIVKAGQTHANNFAGAKITCDGERGIATKKAGIKVLQTAMNLDYNAKLKVDGAFGSASKKALKGHTVRKGESQYMVTALQILLMLKGYNPNGVESPGSFGSGCKAALKKYQKANGLTVDGIAGYNTFISLIS